VRVAALLTLIAFAVLAPLPAHAADAAKTLRVALSIAETSFDPAFASDAASDDVIGAIFDAMLDYDYLARPVKLIPRALEALPTVEDGGRAYLCRVKKGVFFTPDPAFKGVRRELTAADFAYGIKRILDPDVKSPWVWLFEGKLTGSTDARARATKTGRFDYDAPMPGLEVVDRYTLRIRLDVPDLRFPYALALQNVARGARGRRSMAGTSARIRSERVRTCSANTGAATGSSSCPTRRIANRATSPPDRCPKRLVPSPRR
jgi:ABC-type transport system substrate-binding protein